MVYNPRPFTLMVGLGNISPELRAVAGYVEEELRTLALSLVETEAVETRTVNVEPTKPREGMIVIADGTDWDPGSGGGPYVYFGSAWVPLFSASSGPGLPAGGTVDQIIVKDSSTDYDVSWQTVIFLTDGDKGDISVSSSGATFSINDGVVLFAHIQDVTANSILARAAATDGVLSEITLSASQVLGRGSTGDIAPLDIGKGVVISGTTIQGTSPVYLGTVVCSGTTNADITGIGGYTSLFLRVHTIATAAWNNLRVSLSSDNGGSFGSVRILHTGNTALCIANGTATISNTNVTSTNKTITPAIAVFGDIDATGAMGTYTTTATENVITGLINALRFNHSAANGRSIIEVYGIP